MHPWCYPFTKLLLHCVALQVVLCANTPEEYEELLAAGCDAIYCNQNAWLNYHTIFTLEQQPGNQQPTHNLQVNPDQQQNQHQHPGNSKNRQYFPSYHSISHHKKHQQQQRLQQGSNSKEVLHGNLKQQSHQDLDVNDKEIHSQHHDPQQPHKQQGCQPQWDLVVNSNSSPFKRTHLASAVPNKVLIGYAVSPSETPNCLPVHSACINQQPDGSFR